ncbi:thioredoxin [Balneicella halophila]|uniref:Thioredoxin n=1 Tax=Balneicella halophila TaxID=1537566 RepID=A0A7L4URB5_BALHA|nr:thioredoxin [Balneicella halophila]PVX52306.1 thioredoxin [Balneicella halophila]
MRKLFIISIIAIASFITTNISAQEIQHINAEQFQNQVFDYKNETEWNFKGDGPVVIDFYASWCGPCKKVAPILQQLQNEYGDKLTIYKVNIDREKELAAVFGVRSIPAFLFIPKDGKPTMAKGALPKQTFKNAFSEIFGL